MTEPSDRELGHMADALPGLRHDATISVNSPLTLSQVSASPDTSPTIAAKSAHRKILTDWASRFLPVAAVGCGGVACGMAALGISGVVMHADGPDDHHPCNHPSTKPGQLQNQQPRGTPGRRQMGDTHNGGCVFATPTTHGAPELCRVTTPVTTSYSSSYHRVGVGSSVRRTSHRICAT